MKKVHKHNCGQIEHLGLDSGPTEQELLFQQEGNHSPCLETVSLVNQCQDFVCKFVMLFKSHQPTTFLFCFLSTKVAYTFITPAMALHFLIHLNKINSHSVTLNSTFTFIFQNILNS